MAKEKRQAKISYIYDRLWEQKLTQVYRLLVTDNDTNSICDNKLSVEPVKETANENSSDLYESIFRSAKGE